MTVELTSDEPIECFMKAETYQDVKDPRNISTIPANTKLNYSSYLYSFVDNVLNSQSWYAFSKTPREIALRVAEIASSANFIDNTDLSRFDGRVSKKMRMLEHIIMMRWIRSEHKTDLIRLKESQQNQRARTKFGIKFDTKFSRLSGSPETAAFNTVDNAFMAYKALRNTRVDGVFIGPEAAWSKLGIYGGDDGLTADVEPETYVRACASVGQKLDVNVTKRGELGVTFLSRIFSPAVWYGDPSSMCDLRRQLAKLHVTTNLPPDVSPITKLREKLSGFFLTDKNTPILGEYSQVVVHYHGTYCGVSHNIANYFSSYPEHEQFPNENTLDWMDEVVKRDLPKFDMSLFHSWLSTARENPYVLLSPPMCEPPPVEPLVVKRPVVVDDVPVYPIGACKHVTDNKCPFGEKCFHKQNSNCRGPECRFEHKDRKDKESSVEA